MVHPCPASPLLSLWPPEAALQEELQNPEELFQPDADEASLCSTGDQRTTSLLSQKVVTPEDSISQLDSSKAIKVKALTVVAGAGGGMAEE